mmetsp:Transcript_12001/g.28119  ORF Transcript_12001/g.28119 Transcript_12001/m.28119 type:complete len:223 (-) Transcript_12001:421-1089(-)
MFPVTLGLLCISRDLMCLNSLNIAAMSRISPSIWVETRLRPSTNCPSFVVLTRRQLRRGCSKSQFAVAYPSKMCGLRRNSTSFWWLSFSSSFMSAAAASFFIPCSSMISILCSRSLALHRGDVMWKGVCLPAVRIFGNTYSEPVASSLGSNLRVVPKWASIPWWVGLGQAVKWARGAPEAAGADDDSHPLPEAAMACRGLYGAWSWATEGGAHPSCRGEAAP